MKKEMKNYLKTLDYLTCNDTIYYYDNENNVIAFSGSMNETENAFINNYEIVDVFTSWEDKDRVEIKERAFDKLSINLDDCLEGPSAIATSNDAIAPIKVLADFAKTHPALELKGGIVDGKETSLEELKELANVPSRDGLLTMFAAGLMEHVKNVAICLDLHSQNLEEEK